MPKKAGGFNLPLFLCSYNLKAHTITIYHINSGHTHTGLAHAVFPSTWVTLR